MAPSVTDTTRTNETTIIMQPLRAPEDVSYLLQRLNGHDFGGNGYLSLVSASQGIVQHSRVHASTLGDIPRMVSRDAFILLGGRVVGIVQGISERGDALPAKLAERSTKIQESLDLTERNVGLSDPSRSAWRQVAARGHKEAYSGHWTPLQALGMQEGVLAASRIITDIVAGIEGSLRRLSVDATQAARVAKVALAVLAYGEFAPDIANYPYSRSPGADNAARNSVGAIAFASDFDRHPAMESLAPIVTNASGLFRQATLKAMWAPDPLAAATKETRLFAGLAQQAMT